MTDERVDKARGPAKHETEWERSERASDRIALAIALVPIPVSLLISWALGSPPWRPNRWPGDRETRGASTALERPGPMPRPEHR